MHQSPAEHYESLALSYGRFIPHPDSGEHLFCATTYGHLPDFEDSRRELSNAIRAGGTQRTAARHYWLRGGRVVSRPVHTLADRKEVAA